MSLENLKPEFIFAMCLAAGGAVWKAILMVFNWHDRLKAVESIAVQQGKELVAIKQTVEQQYLAVRSDIKEVRAESAEQHKVLFTKLDKIIDRELDK